MRSLRLFAIGVLAQAAFGVAALLVTRWGFRSWPQGSYTWIPGLLAFGGLIVAALLGYALGVSGMPFGLAVAAWYLGRVIGALASSLVVDVGMDASLLARASFGMLVLDDGRLGPPAPSLWPAIPPIAALTLAWAWGRRGGDRVGHDSGGQPATRPPT